MMRLLESEIRYLEFWYDKFFYLLLFTQFLVSKTKKWNILTYSFLNWCNIEGENVVKKTQKKERETIRQTDRDRQTERMGRMTWNFTINKVLDISEIYAKSVVKQEYE